MRVGDLTPGELQARLAGDGFSIQFGPFAIKIRSDIGALCALAHALYEPYPLAPSAQMADFHVDVSSRPGLRRWLRPQCRFRLDGRSPFAPYPVAHAFPALEWGINWCVATRAHHLLMLHSAVVERDGLAILFPAWPGHGKSTLCAALIHSGWRLLSDEFGLVRPEDGMLLPMPRLIPLKNESIDVLRGFRPEALIGPSFHGTRKGTVAHVRPPQESIRRAQEPARARWLVFPRWVKGAPLSLEPLAKSQAFLMLASNSFNYQVLDATAFRLVAAMVRDCGCHALVYSDLNEAVTALDALARSAHD